MMDIDSLAQALFGSKRAETQEVSTDGTTRTYTGVALTDSEDGTVVIDLGGDVTLPDDLYDEGGNVVAEWDGVGVEMPTSPQVSAGDDVIVTLMGGSATKTPMVTSSAGSGDRMRTLVNAAQTVANAAQAVAEAVNQHFFADTSGIHVTEATQEDWDTNHTGANVLINSIGQLFRDGLNNLLTLTTENGARALTIWDGLGNAAGNIRAVIGETIQLGKASGSHVTIDDDSMEYYANETEQVFQFVGSKDGDDSLTSYYATIRDGITRTGDTIIPPQKSRIRLMTTTRQSGSEKVVISSNAELYAYTRNGEGASISVDMLNDTDGTKRSNVYLSADAIQALGTTYVNDPYRNGYKLELGRPTRLSANKSMTLTNTSGWTDGPSVNLHQGEWLVVGVAAFNTGSSSGVRKLRAQLRLGTSVYAEGTEIAVANNVFGRIEAVAVMSPSSETTATLVLQSGMTFTAAATSYITAIRLA